MLPYIDEEVTYRAAQRPVIPLSWCAARDHAGLLGFVSSERQSTCKGSGSNSADLQATVRCTAVLPLPKVFTLSYADGTFELPTSEVEVAKANAKLTIGSSAPRLMYIDMRTHCRDIDPTA